MNRVLLTVFLVFITITQVYGWSGRVIGIVDGDTVKVFNGTQAETIRLYGIDCPEKKQAFGTAAKKFTSDMIFGKTVTVNPVCKDRYGRTVANISYRGADLSLALVKAGLAWWYVKYAPHDKKLEEAEIKARESKIGLWSEPSPVPPWKFRKKPKKS